MKTILECTNELIQEEKKKKSKKSDSADKEENDVQFHERIKFNKWKKALMEKNIIRIGQPKKIYGPHEDRPPPPKPLPPPPPIPQTVVNPAPTQNLGLPKLPEPTKQISPTLGTPGSAQEKKNKEALIGDSPDKVLKSMIKLTQGMEKALGKKSYRCKSCGFPIPRYKGRYPSKCSNCKKEFSIR